MAGLATLKAQKRLLRKAISRKLADLTNIAEQSEAITSRVLQLPAFCNATALSCYLNMPNGEVDTGGIVQSVLAQTPERSLFVPHIDAVQDGKMHFLKIYGPHDLNSLPVGTWGIKQPGDMFNGNSRTSATDAGITLDLILVPGVAFDRSMSRLGHGKGYYDRFISDFANDRTRKPPFLVGLALREQLLAAHEIPIGEHDWKMDMIITPDEVISQS